MLKRMQRFSAAVGLLLLLGGAEQLSAQSYQVVVNAGNSVASMTASDLSRLFQKKTTRWDNGQTVIPVDLPENSSVRVAFSRGVHRKSVSALKAYWQRQIFSGRGVPPVEKVSNTEVLQYVAANASAIGYVSANATVGRGVKVIQVTGGGA